MATTFAYTPGGPLAQKQGSVKRIYLKDVHGDVVGMTNDSGVVRWTPTQTCLPHAVREICHALGAAVEAPLDLLGYLLGAGRRNLRTARWEQSANVLDQTLGSLPPVTAGG